MGLTNCSKRIGKRKKKAHAGLRATKLTKAKRTSVPRKAKVVRRETCSERKCQREEEGDAAVEESPRMRRKEGFEVLSEGELDLNFFHNLLVI